MRGQTTYVVAGFAEDVFLLCGEGGIALELIDHHVEGIDNGVARHEDLALGFLFFQVALAQRCGREVICRDAARDLAVHLLRPGAVDVVGAEASLDMTHGYLLIEGS